MGCIYLIRNRENGKCYIGQTVQDVIKDRIRRHLNSQSGGSHIIKRAIAKHGKDAFEYEILHDGIIPDFLDMLEREAIAKYNALAPNGYNLTRGGECGKRGGTTSTEHRRKIGQALKGNTHTLGKKHSAETRAKMSRDRKGKNNAFYGKSHSAKSRKQMSDSLKGENHPFYGKPHSPEHRQRISDSNRTPIYYASKTYFYSLPADMSLAEKRQQVKAFSGKRMSTVWRWINEWKRGD